MESYQYEPIKESEVHDTIRVLTLAPGAQDDDLAGSLTAVSVSTPIQFEAISYTWDRQPHKDSIVCDGGVLKITPGLGAALRRLRQGHESRTIWVDQICINQANPIERSQQVQHMNPIYSRATKVLVWLGDDQNHHARRAFALVKSLTAISQDGLLFSLFKDKREGIDWFPAECWVALSELFMRPWFDRKWILQEIGTNAPAELFWGDEVVDWDAVTRAAILLKDHGYALRRKYDLLVWKPQYMNKLFCETSYENKALNFTYELHRARWQRATDPRDHIFALLGHPSARVHMITADYMRSVEDVYHDVAVRILNGADSLMLLNVVQHDGLEEGRDLPTWVPQWDVHPGLHNLLGDDTCIYRPSKNIPPSLQFSDDTRMLLVDGLRIDAIRCVSSILDTSDLTFNSPTVARLWKHECGYNELNTTATYVDGQPALFALLETLSAIKKRKAEAPNFLSTRLCDGANFLVRAFGKTHVISDDVREMSSSGDCDKWMERASGGAKNRRLACSIRGFYALCPPAAREGDVLCLLWGGKTLYCLRESIDHYLFIGECYVHGLMDGEAIDMLDRGELVRTTFKIG